MRFAFGPIKTLLACGALAAAIFYIGCGGDDGTDDPGGGYKVPESAVASATIGTEGGTLSVTEGELAGVAVEVPAGALAEERVIYVAPGDPYALSGGSAAGPPVRFRDTEFLAAVTVTLPFDPALLPDSATMDDVAVQHYHSQDDMIVRDTIVPTSIDEAGKTLTFQVDKFSEFTPFVEYDRLYAWGDHIDGIDNTVDVADFDTAPLAGAVKIADCYHSVLLRADGSVRVWAPPPTAYYTEVGPDDLMGALTEAVGSTPKAVDVSCGRYSSFVLLNDGTIWSWGNKNCFDVIDACDSRLGRAIAGEETEVPGQVEGVVDAIKISSGWGYTVALQADGTVIGWGNNEYGQLGIGEAELDFAMPTPVAGNHPVFTDIAAGWDFAFALAADGTVWSWGHDSGFNSKLARNVEDRTIPAMVLMEDGTPLPNIVAIAAGAEHGVALDGDGAVFVWGDGQDGAIGLGPNWNDADRDPLYNWANRAQPVPGLPPIESIAAGGMITAFVQTPRTAAVDTEGRLYLWGTLLAEFPGAETPQFNPYYVELTAAQQVFMGWDNTFVLVK